MLPQSSTPTSTVVGMPIVTRFLTLWLPLTYFLCLVGPGSSSGHSVVLKYFALIPANTFLVHSYPWTFVTHVFVENNGFLLALSLAALATMGRKLEEEWGTRKFLLLILLAAISSSLAIVVNTAVVYGLFGSMSLFEYFAGFLPCAMALVVGYWQRSADDPLSMAFSPSSSSEAMLLPTTTTSNPSSSTTGTLGSTLRVRHMAFLCFVGLLFYEFLFGPKTLKEEDIVPGEDDLFPGSDTYPALCALWWCWFVLRFCLLSVRSMSVDSGLCGLGYAGDPSPNFALHMCIPFRPLQLFFQHSISNLGFRLLLFVGLGSAVKEYDPNARYSTSEGAVSDGAVATSTASVSSTKLLPSTSSTVAVNIGPTAGAAAAAGASTNGTVAPIGISASAAPAGGAGAPLSEADRRRQIAMQALQSRLSNRQQQPNNSSTMGSTRREKIATPPAATSLGNEPQQKIL